MPASRLPRCPRARESNVPETRGRVTPFPLATPANRLRRRRGASGDGSGQPQRPGATRTLRGASDSAATGGGPRSGPFHRVPTTLPAPHPPTSRVFIAQGAACPSPRPPRSPPSARAHPQWPGTPEDGRPCYNQPVNATVAVKASGVGAVKMGPTLLLQVTPERMACPTRRPLKGKSALPTALAPLQLRARSPGEGSWPVPPRGQGSGRRCHPGVQISVVGAGLWRWTLLFRPCAGRVMTDFVFNPRTRT